MNLRFPEIFGLILFAMLLCSFALPRSVSGRVENSLQFVFAPVTGPIQWMTAGRSAQTRESTPLLPQVSDEITRLREEKIALENLVERLTGQLSTLRNRETEADRIGGELVGRVTTVKVIGPDANGRDVLRLAGTSSGVIEKDQPVVTSNGLVGRVLDVGIGNQSSVRLITDRGAKLVAKFGRYQTSADGTAQLLIVSDDPTLVEGMGGGLMRIQSLTLATVERLGLRERDAVFLADAPSAPWPIELHGYRVGTITQIKEKLELPGVADIIVTPGDELLKLRDVWVMTRKQP